jgi:uncharacterized protein (TIGR00297 family)
MHLFWLLISVGTAFLAAERAAKMHLSYSLFYRKALHIWTGAMILIALLDPVIPLKYLLIIGLLVSLISFVAFNLNWLSLDEQLGRRDPGLFYFALAFTLLILIWGESNRELIIMSYSLIVLADPMATLIGYRAGWRIRTGPIDKSIWGSLVFLLISFLGLWVLDIWLLGSDIELHRLIWCLGLAFLATLIEWISPWGTDNLFVPILIAPLIELFLFQNDTNAMIGHALGWLLGGIFLLFAYRRGLLSKDGALSALILAIIIMSIRLWDAAIPMLYFFFSAALLGKWNKKWDHREIKEAKGRSRDLVQVFANGGVAMLALVLGVSPCIDANHAYLIFLVVMAGSTADTWATEIGTMKRGSAYFLIGWKKVPVGLSGGVSVWGTFAAFVGAFSMGVVAVALGAMDWHWIWWVAGLGWLSSLFDSLLGQFLQYRWKDQGRWREDRPHGAPVHSSGYRWITNDMVNLLSGMAIALIAGLAL